MAKTPSPIMGLDLSITSKPTPPNPWTPKKPVNGNKVDDTGKPVPVNNGVYDWYDNGKGADNNVTGFAMRHPNETLPNDLTYTDPARLHAIIGAHNGNDTSPTTANAGKARTK